MFHFLFVVIFLFGGLYLIGLIFSGGSEVVAWTFVLVPIVIGLFLGIFTEISKGRS